MRLAASQLIRVTCTNVVDYPHDGIVSQALERSYSPDEAEMVAHAVRVIHFCRGDPHSAFDDGAGDAPIDELRVRETTLAWFMRQGRDAHIVIGPPSPFSPGEIVGRARASLGLGGHAFCKRNFQSFATNCYYGVAHSEAVLRAGYWIAGGLVALAVSLIFTSQHLRPLQINFIQGGGRKAK